ncbi:MAG: NADH-quinone oxidoreductase subunit NuoH [Bdellovibrionaceae bacterium]|nr:NADH-quinone oxidoreductase subunit NuoH [Pseudobdellovibrionaceae bacterium]
MMDDFWWITTGLKVLFVLIVLLQVTPIMVWVERRGSALIQNRLGPNRVGPLGLIQSLADALKFIFKEDRVPGHAYKFYYFLAPLISLIPAFMTFAVVPFASSIMIDGREVVFQAAEMNVGLLYIFAIASLGVYGIIMAGWASNNKYALFGSLRSTAQMISYELSMGLSIVGILMVFSSVELGEIARGQGEILFQLGPFAIQKWGVFIQPVGFFIFLTSVFAETNRLPFDLPEGESEIVAGYHLEYGSMKMALFFMAEYVNMFTGAAVVSTLFFGGWQMLPGMPLILDSLGFTGMTHEWTRVLFEHLSFGMKVAFFMWLFVWVRWTLPRFRYDQLMDIGWKFMLPLSLVNIFVTGMMIYWGVL